MQEYQLPLPWVKLIQFKTVYSEEQDVVLPVLTILPTTTAELGDGRTNVVPSKCLLLSLCDTSTGLFRYFMIG